MSTETEQKFSLGTLIALVVGSMVGAGIFSLPATFGRATGGLGAIIAWCIAGSGMLMLAFVFQNLAERKPNLDSGVFAYAQAGFGNYVGFISALGFWTGCCVANVSFFILVKSTLGAFFPIFGDGNTPSAVAVASVLLWCFHILILRGVKGAAAINTLTTIAKIVPLIIFLGFVIWAFKTDIFVSNFWGGTTAAALDVDLSHFQEYGYVGHAAEMMPVLPNESLFNQVRSTMLVTVFVFVGIEGASVYSRLAKKRKDVGIATVFGFLGVLCLLVLVTLLSYGILERHQLASLRQRSMAGVMESIVGRWGTIFISIGLIISVLGAYLSWTLLASEVLFAAAKSKAMPAFLMTQNAQQVPVSALWLTNILVQLFLILTLFTSSAFDLALELTSALCLIPYLLVAAYGLKLAWTKETYETIHSSLKKDLTIAIIATFYACLMLVAGGVKYLLLSAIIYAPGSILFIIAQREQKQAIFVNRLESYLFILILAAAATAILGVLLGYLTI